MEEFDFDFLQELFISKWNISRWNTSYSISTDLLSTRISAIDTARFAFDVLFVVLGLPTNLLAAVVLFSLSLRRRPSNQQLAASRYLAAMALAHLCHVSLFVLDCLAWMGVAVWSYNGSCQVYSYFLLLSGSLAAWFLLGFVLLQYLTVSGTLEANVVTKLMLTRAVVIGLTLVGVLHCLFLPMATEAAYGACRFKADSWEITVGLLQVSYVISGFVPYSIIIVLSALTLCRLRSSGTVTRASRFEEVSARLNSSSSDHQPTDCRTQVSVNLRTACAILVMSLLSLPCLAYSFYSLSDDHHQEHLIVHLVFLNVYYLVLYSCIFYIYYSFSPDYQRAVLRLLSFGTECMKRKLLRKRIQMRSSSEQALDSDSVFEA